MFIYQAKESTIDVNKNTDELNIIKSLDCGKKRWERKKRHPNFISMERERGLRKGKRVRKERKKKKKIISQ